MRASSEAGSARAGRLRGVSISFLLKGFVVLECGLIKRAFNSGDSKGGREESLPDIIGFGKGPAEYRIGYDQYY